MLLLRDVVGRMKKVRPVWAMNCLLSIVISKTKFPHAIRHIAFVKKNTSVSLPIKNYATTGTNGYAYAGCNNE